MFSQIKVSAFEQTKAKAVRCSSPSLVQELVYSGDLVTMQILIQPGLK